MGSKRAVTKAKRMTKQLQDTDVAVRVKPSVQISVAIMMIAALVAAAGFIAPFLLSTVRETAVESATVTAPTHFEIAEAYAPAWYQDTHSDVWSDMIVAFNFDGDYIGNNNWNNQACCAPLANIYYYVLETDTHWFIHYPVFHAKDDGPLPCWTGDCHENDAEGALIVVKKTSNLYGELQYIETRFHNEFKKYTPEMLERDNERQVRLFIEASDHGVKNDTSVTQSLYGNFVGEDGYIYRYTGTAERSDFFNDDDPLNRTIGYALMPYEEEFWNNRDNCCGSGHMFDIPFTYDGERFSFEYMIPNSLDGDDHQDDKANPTWAMDEDGDTLAKGDWGIDPAWTIHEHFSPSGDYSLDYISNFFLDCDDGTRHGQCNTTTNEYCNAGQLSPCPNNTGCNVETLTCEAGCSDGTPSESCSVSMPWFCSAIDLEVPDPPMPRMVCVYRTGQEGGENDACEVVALVSDPKPDFYQLNVDDWRQGRDPFITEKGYGQFSGRYMCDPDHAGGECARDCWNIIGTNSNNEGDNDGLDNVFCLAGAGCSPVSFSGCPSESPACITSAMNSLADVYHKVVYYHWVADEGGTRRRDCSDDNGDQSYAIGLGFATNMCAAPRCIPPTPDDLYDGFWRLGGLVVLESDMVPTPRNATYILDEQCLSCGCPSTTPYCDTVNGDCEARCSDGTLFGECNNNNQYCNAGELLSYQCGLCGIGCPSGYSCSGGECCRKIGGQWKCVLPYIYADSEADAATAY